MSRSARLAILAAVLILRLARNEQLATVFGQAASAKVVADASVSPGGCIVTTEFGSIDLQFETQLKRLAEEMS